MSARLPTPRLPDELHPLVLDNIGLAYEFANRSWRNSGKKLDLDDLVQVAVEGLVYGVIKYDPTRNNEMSTYVCYWIRQRLQLHVWKESSGGVNVPPNKTRRPQKAATVVGMTWEEGLPDPRSLGDQEPGAGIEPGPFWATIRRLTADDPRSQQLLGLLYRQGMTYKEAGRELGVCQERIRQLKMRVLQGIRDKVGCAGELLEGVSC